ncbi:MAG TPA: methyltransferase domain-containing protein [Thermomicrobiaceae bacterium]|nr:methyltransferase domain-containing protein [Thermomicrobiaceae bacterium]
MAELKKVGARGRLLDFGAGTGELAARLARSGLFNQVTAADIANYRHHCHTTEKVDWIYGDLNLPLAVPDSTFDTIIAVEVLEHLENPRGVAREWNRLLKPGGWLLITTPNVESWRSVLSLVFRGHFIAFTAESYPAHITALTRLDLHRILDETSFSNISVFYSEYGVVPRLTFLSWQRISNGRLSGVRYSDNVGIVAQKRIEIAS